MAYTGMTPATNSGFIPEIWLATALGRLPQYINLARTVTMDRDLPTGETFTLGKTLHLPKRGAVIANNEGTNGQVTVQAPQSSTVDLSLTNFWDATFQVDSLAMAFQNQDAIAGYIEDGMIALAEKIELSIATTMAAGAGKVISVAGALTEGNYLSARQALVDNKVPASQRKFAVISTGNTNAILQIDRLVRYDALGVSNNIANATIGNGVRDVSTMDGAIGRLHGFETAESQFAKTGDGSPATDDNFFYAKTAVLMASRSLPLPEPGTGAVGTVMTDESTGITMRLISSWNPTYNARQISLDVLWGVTMMRPEHAVLVKTAAQ